MSITHHIEPELAAEVSALKGLVSRLLRVVERSDDASLTFPEFCTGEMISRGFLYELMKGGRGPRRSCFS